MLTHPRAYGCVFNVQVCVTRCGSVSMHACVTWCGRVSIPASVKVRLRVHQCVRDWHESEDGRDVSNGAIIEVKISSLFPPETI